jgi:hypothetical protein
MFIDSKHLSRRTVLKGLGVTVALPLLDAMVPAGRAWARTAPAAMGRTRFIGIEMVHGAAGSTNFGGQKHLWAPAATGRDFDLAPSSLNPLAPFRDHLTIISNTDVHAAEAWQAREAGGDHYRSSAAFFTQCHPRQTESSDIEAGTSIDQLYARRFGQDTPVPSLQLCIENVDQAGGCSYGYACVYTDTISWAAPTQPLPMIRDPRVVFDQLFGSGTTREERMARARADRSILDRITKKVARLQGDLGSSDRARLTEYLDHIREIERRIQKVELRNSSGESRELPEAPPGVPDSFEEHVKLMFDLQVLAFAADLTRVISFKMGRDVSNRIYPESGVKTPFHVASHHQEKEDRILDYARLNTYHVSLLPYFLEKLQKTSNGDGNLLDQTLIVYGSPMGDSNIHDHKRCPLFLVGHADGRVKGNLHIRTADGAPMANAMLGVLHALGLDDLSTFGDSTGAIDLNSVQPAQKSA